MNTHRTHLLSCFVVPLLAVAATPATGPADERSCAPQSESTNRLQPADFTYVGAFRLPGGDVRPKTFAYGGNAMTVSAAA